MVASYLENCNLNNHLGLRRIHIVNELFGEGQLCRSVAYDDCISTVHLLNSFQVEQLSQPGDNLSEFLRKHRVFQIKGAQNLVLEIPALLRLVRDKEDDVACHWLPECLCLNAYHFKRLFESDICKFDGNAPRCKVGIEDHR